MRIVKSVKNANNNAVRVCSPLKTVSSVQMASTLLKLDDVLLHVWRDIIRSYQPKSVEHASNPVSLANPAPTVYPVMRTQPFPTFSSTSVWMNVLSV